MTKTKLILDETDDEAWGLPQMVKRMTRDHIRRLSANESEREDMDCATNKLRRALAEAGFERR